MSIEASDGEGELMLCNACSYSARASERRPSLSSARASSIRARVDGCSAGDSTRRRCTARAVLSEDDATEGRPVAGKEGGGASVSGGPRRAWYRRTLSGPREAGRPALTY